MRRWMRWMLTMSMRWPRPAQQIRQWIVDIPFPQQLEAEIKAAYEKITTEGEGSFAVRSSATAEDLPDASFAGQQETFLNIHGYENILHAIKEVFASLYNDRAIAYRVHKDFAHAEVALSAGVQRMVRSDTGAVGGDVLARYRVGISGGRVRHVVLRSRRDGGAGRGEPGRVLRAQSHAC